MRELLSCGGRTSPDASRSPFYSLIPLIFPRTASVYAPSRPQEPPLRPINGDLRLHGAGGDHWGLNHPGSARTERCLDPSICFQSSLCSPSTGTEEAEF